MQFMMGFMRVVFCIGLLGFAGACGVFLGWLEKKAMEERNEADRYNRE